MPDLYLDMGAARVLSAAGIPEYVNAAGASFPVGAYAFDTTTVESVFFQFHITGYTSGNLTLVGDWYAAATTGAVVFQAALAAMTSGTDSVAVTSKSLATANSSSAITARGTTLYPNSLSI